MDPATQSPPDNAYIVAEFSPRLPFRYAGKKIGFRIPFNMYAELLIPIDAEGNVAGSLPFSGQFPEGSALHNVDKPFEIHRFIPRITLVHSVISNGLVTQDQVILGQGPVSGWEKAVRLRIQDTSKNENLTKTAMTIEDMVADDTRAWEWEDPYTIVRSEGFLVEVDVLAVAPAPGTTSGTGIFTQAAVDAECQCVAEKVHKIRIDIDFQGYLIVIAPPSEYR